MKLFLIIMGVIFTLLFVAICVVDKIILKEKKDPVFADKMKSKREKWKKYDPIYTFFYNAFGWILALLVFYYIYLG